MSSLRGFRIDSVVICTGNEVMGCLSVEIFRKSGKAAVVLNAGNIKSPIERNFRERQYFYFYDISFVHYPLSII